MDTTVLVAITGLVTTLITTGGVIAVALIKRDDDGEEATASVLRERLAFRVEVNEALKYEIEHKEGIITRLKDRIDELEVEVIRLRTAVEKGTPSADAGR